ncbi:MAG: ADP-ribosylglycohydrolase family protein [Bacillus sp. (in: firmicutes)]
MLNQMKAALLGVAVGDALGVPVEFMKRDTYPAVTEMIGYGTHNQPPGTWSDDSSMTFCLVESLCNGYDIEDMKQKFCDWLYEGYWTFNGKDTFDVGITTSRVLLNIQTGRASKESGEKSEYSNGNGSLMRILPIAFYVKNMNEASRFSIIEEVSGITHAHIRSKIACSIYIEMAIHLLDGHTLKEAYEKMKIVITEHYFSGQNQEEWSHFEKLLNHDISLLPRNEVKSSGYVIDTLEASLWCLLTTDSFRDAVLTAVNLGDDTDTVGAVVGGLAGIYYGLGSIPKEWLQVLAKKEEIEDLSERFSKALS